MLTENAQTNISSSIFAKKSTTHLKVPTKLEFKERGEKETIKEKKKSSFRNRRVVVDDGGSINTIWNENPVFGGDPSRDLDVTRSDDFLSIHTRENSFLSRIRGAVPWIITTGEHRQKFFRSCRLRRALFAALEHIRVKEGGIATCRCRLCCAQHRRKPDRGEIVFLGHEFDSYPPWLDAI